MNRKLKLKKMDLSYFKLRCTLLGHSMAIRAVAVNHCAADIVITGSRDRTTRAWAANEGDPNYTESHVMTGPTNYVSSICCLPPTEQYAMGLIMVGSNDCCIYVFSLDSPQPKYKLLGHSDTVCSLAAGKFGTVVSGSWDKTARIWLGQKCMMTLEGHQAAVWAVEILPEQGLILTGSADKTIRMWRAGFCEKTFAGHEDCVRALATLSTFEFLSCSNDATIRLWKITGECLRIYEGHTNYIYSIAVIPDTKEFVTCSEDRTLRVWKEDSCVQVIRIPSQCAWSVAALQNGDIVAGLCDGSARIFTRQADLQASSTEQEVFEKEIADSELTVCDIGDLKLSELPGPEALLEPGKQDGQTKLIRDGNSASCYQWNQADSRWLKVGDIVGASGSTQATSGKTLHEGLEYDYVFNVDIDENKVLKLPYNITEDPWHAAQRFIHKNDLSQYFLDQVANFIITNTKGMTLGPVAPPEVCDPFTGSGRYVPGSSSVGAVANNHSDPFTSEGRYVPPSSTHLEPQPAYDQMARRGSTQLRESACGDNGAESYFPQKTFLKFDTANSDGISNKLQEFSRHVPTDQTISEAQITDLLKLTTSENIPTETQIGILEKIIRWPHTFVFPALDVLRLAVRVASVNTRICKSGPKMISHLLSFLTPSSLPANQMLALRTLVNLFAHADGEQLILNQRQDILTAARNCVESTNKNVQIALATLLLNYSVSFGNKKDREGKSQCLSLAAMLLQKMVDTEANFRLLVTLGTLTWGDPQSIAFARTLNVICELERLSNTSNPARVAQCATYLAALLK